MCPQLSTFQCGLAKVLTTAAPCACVSHVPLQAGPLTVLLMKSAPYFRDRILADNMFLFKVGAEVVIDSGA